MRNRLLSFVTLGPAGYHRRLIFTIGLVLSVVSGVLMPISPLSVLAISTPTLVSPDDGITTTVATYPPLAVPEFRWDPVSGATKYRIQVAGDIGFTTKILDITTPNTSHTPTSISLWNEGTWYWRVRVELPTASEYSGIWSFTKQWASLDNAPILVSPDSDATIDFYDTPIFSWLPATGAASYRFQIASSETGFASPIYNQLTLAPSHQPTAKLTNGSYYWRVVPVDPSNNRNGTPSEVRPFTVNYDEVPTLLEPADGASPTFAPTFRWTAVRGAELYLLQYSTDPTFLTDLTAIETRNTTYIPPSYPPNDVNYYWRVRVESGNSIGAWSASRTFVRKWYDVPELLIPANGDQSVNGLLFSWTPVPGANYYNIEFSDSTSFPLGCNGTAVANPYYVYNAGTTATSGQWKYWRVTPVDSSDNCGKPSSVWSYKYVPNPSAPQLISPLFYYTPADTLQPHEDRTVALPVFTWHRTFTFNAGMPAPEVPAYRIEVDDDPEFGSVNWSFDTENMAAVPTATDPFTPIVGAIYYWRVRSLDGIGGNSFGDWSDVWRTRFDPALGLTPTAGLSPTLLRPAHGSESVEASPLLEWWPRQGADSYEVQISADSGFGSLAISATVPYPAYAPEERLSFGTYYWRVRARSGGFPVGNWSDGWRFQVAAQSQWRQTRELGNPINQLLIASDSAGDMSNPAYDLTSLYGAQSKDYWFFSFNAPVTDTTPVTYALYLDLNHLDGSGATNDARGYNVATIPAHRPEYAIYISHNGGAFSVDDVSIYGWNASSSSWNAPQSLSSVGGGLFSTGNYVEIEVPNTIIGMEERTGSAAISLFSALAAGGHAQDTVPSDPNVAYGAPDGGGGTTTLSRFTSLSERLNLAYPPSNVTGDPTTFPSVLPFAWHWPVGTSFKGYDLQIALDPEFTTPAQNVSWTGSVTYSTPAKYTSEKDLQGDNTYYWRMRPIYTSTYGLIYKGAWSQSGRFERKGFVLQAPLVSVNSIFSWDMLEGAKSYDIQIDSDPDFSPSLISANGLAPNSYTPVKSLGDGTYYWRVRARRFNGAYSSGDIMNAWTEPYTFTVRLPVPTGLSHSPDEVVPRAPTLCWTPVLSPTVGDPVLAAWKYRVQVSNDLTFSSSYDSVDTEQACWTPTKGYADGTYYWRVAMKDGNNNLGSYGAAAQFTKQYPITTLLEPADGGTGAGTPTFVWTPVNGAAQYKLEVSNSPSFVPLYDSATTNNTRFTPTKTYPTSGQTYYWRVAMVDKDNKMGPFTDATVILQPTPTPTATPTASATPTSTPTITPTPTATLPPRLYLPVVIRNYSGGW